MLYFHHKILVLYQIALRLLVPQYIQEYLPHHAYQDSI